MLNRISFRVKIMIVLLLTATFSFGVVSFLGYYNGRQAVEDAAFMQLTSIREIKKRSIENYFNDTRNILLINAESPIVVEAAKEFTATFNNLAKGISGKQLADYESSVRGYYQNEFLPRLNKNIAKPQTIDPFWPSDPRTIVNQYNYIANNPNKVGEKHKQDAATAGTAYDKVHAKYHGYFRNLWEKFKYYDVFIVEPEEGYIVYTVFKETDYCTSLLTGPYKNTKFAHAFAEVRNNPKKGAIKLVDFEEYAPSYSAPAAFMAAPIMEGDKLVAVLLVQLPIDEINNIMLASSSSTWDLCGCNCPSMRLTTS